MDERGGGSRVGQVVCGDVDGLDRGDGALGGGGDALLEVAHLGCQSGLVANSGGHAAQKCGNLRTSLGEAEDVVDEEQNVLTLIAEVLCCGQAGEADAQTGSGRLVHLAVDHAGLVDNARLVHLEVEVRTLTGALANAGEHGGAAVLLGQVVDELHDENGLANACTAEEAGLAAQDVGLDQVDDLDAGLEGLGGGGQLVEGGSRMVDGVPVGNLGHGLVVNGLADDVPDAAEGLGTDGHLDGAAGVDNLKAALEAVGRAHSNRTDHVALEVGLHLENGLHMTHRRISLDRQRVVDRRDGVCSELAVHDSTNDANDASNVHVSVLLIHC